MELIVLTKGPVTTLECVKIYTQVWLVVPVRKGYVIVDVIHDFVIRVRATNVVRFTLGSTAFLAELR
jgi:hypothetical protein